MMDLVSYEIRDVLKRSGECFLCTLEGELEQKYVEHYLYEQVMDPVSREAIVASRGFCNYHAYLMFSETAKPKTTDGLNLTLLMQSVNQAFMKDIEKHRTDLRDSTEFEELLLGRIELFIRNIKSHVSRSKGDKTSGLKKDVCKMISFRKHCPACKHVDYFVKVYADKFVDALGDRDQRVVDLFKESRGLCIPHYSTVLFSLSERLPSLRQMPVALEIIDVQLLNMKRLDSEFSEFIRKHDYRFYNELLTMRQDIVSRGILKLSGKRGAKSMLEWDEEHALEVECSTEDHSVLSDNPVSKDHTSEIVRCKSENEFLKKRNDELTGELFKKNSEYSSLHFKTAECFEDNKVMTIQLSGLRAENSRLKTILQKHGLIKPSNTEEEIGKDKELREKYLFGSREKS
jgi:hypothetical protein